MDVNKVHTREQNMHPEEIMVSESQERMLIITRKQKLKNYKKFVKNLELMFCNWKSKI